MVLAAIPAVKWIKSIEFTPDEGITLSQAYAAAEQVGASVRAQLGQDEPVEVHFRLGSHNYDIKV